jgi:hypothetical protein
VDGGLSQKNFISNYYKIGLTRACQSRKFKSRQNVFNISLKELPEKENSTFVRRLFRDMLQRKMQTQLNDYLCVNIDQPSVDSPVWLGFTQAKNFG